MGRRSKARECAFQILYQWQVGREAFETALEGFWRLRSGNPEMRALAERLARGACSRCEELDRVVGEVTENWRADRIAAVERTILRLGAYELLAETATPTAVVLDEAVELAKRFGEADSPGFVNGVLDAVAKRLRAPAAAGRAAGEGASDE